MRKIISYNVNGIRAALGKDFIGWLKQEDPDILLIQETKAQPEQIETHLFEELGYHCYWFSAEKKGYSGVGILTKEKPDKVVIGVDNPKYDVEGRSIRADFGDVSVFSTYHPSGTVGGPRQDYKMEWLAYFQEYITELKKERPNLIIGGDYNICHKEIDISKPEKKKGVSGFLPEEREWVSQFIESGFIDSFREFDLSPDKYSWWSYRAGSRGKNLGWRLDYHMVSEPLRNQLKGGSILADVIHSDHCPIVVEVDF
ncbi:exodeoxyribonuclease III [Labilibaculum antarcticum]|uniref:Exodeoxyribonuclease III n=1 Tax=Labilibaculum antarcticum TaxID=1717717 RepID=A0A1Y1CJ80_9BACT|nr:exodeoxyribonuclease III [Labilibaculum antarcticum]BAX80133.1 exodeoxyribonuclease III [Labilibaculum antarcticum]